MKSFVHLSIFAVVAVASMMGLASIAQTATAEAAIVGKSDEVCSIFHGDFGFSTGPCSWHLVTTHSNNDNFYLKIHKDVRPASDGKARQFNYENTGFVCNFLDGNGNFRVTTDWQETISANGKANLTCKFKN